MTSVKPLDVDAKNAGPAAPTQPDRLKLSQKVLFGIGIAEVTVGSLAFLFSAILLGLSFGDAKYAKEGSLALTLYRLIYSVGEGIWCGIWVVIAGSLGIFAGKQRPTVRMFNLLMGFTMVALIFSVIMILLAIVSARINHRFKILVALEVMVGIFGLLSLIFCVVSAIYCWMAGVSAGFAECFGGFFFRLEPKGDHTKADVEGQKPVTSKPTRKSKVTSEPTRQSKAPVEKDQKPKTDPKKTKPGIKDPTLENKKPIPEIMTPIPEIKRPNPEIEVSTPENEEPTPEIKKTTPENKEPTQEKKEPTPEKAKSTEKDLITKNDQTGSDAVQPKKSLSGVEAQAPQADKQTPEPDTQTPEADKQITEADKQIPEADKQEISTVEVAGSPSDQ